MRPRISGGSFGDRSQAGLVVLSISTASDFFGLLLRRQSRTVAPTWLTERIYCPILGRGLGARVCSGVGYPVGDWMGWVYCCFWCWLSGRGLDGLGLLFV